VLWIASQPAHFLINREETISEKDFPTLEKLCKNIVKENQEFERLEMSKEELLEMFKVLLFFFCFFFFIRASTRSFFSFCEVQRHEAPLHQGEDS